LIIAEKRLKTFPNVLHVTNHMTNPTIG
jgi:hypothetical protein